MPDNQRSPNWNESDRALIDAVRTLRRRLAPVGSWRERLARAIYVPIVTRLSLAAQMGENGAAVPRTVQIDGQPYRLPNDGPVRRVLVLKLDHMGDLVLGMPALRAVRDGFPDAHITLLCGGWNESLAHELAWIDRVVTFDFFTRLNRDWSAPRQELYELGADATAGTL